MTRDSDHFIREGQVSLDELVEQGWDVADKYDFGSRDNILLPSEDDE